MADKTADQAEARLAQSEPVLSIEVDWANDDPPALVPGVLITQIGKANGWPVYRVSAKLALLVYWVATQYVGMVDNGEVRSLAECFDHAHFVKVNEAFAQN